MDSCHRTEDLAETMSSACNVVASRVEEGAYKDLASTIDEPFPALSERKRKTVFNLAELFEISNETSGQESNSVSLYRQHGARGTFIV